MPVICSKAIATEALCVQLQMLLVVLAVLLDLSLPPGFLSRGVPVHTMHLDQKNHSNSNGAFKFCAQNYV